MRNEILKFGRIRNMRIDMNLSQKEVADHLKIAQNTFSQYETGERNIPNETLIQLALFYNTSTDYLLELTDQKEPYPKSKKLNQDKDSNENRFPNKNFSGSFKIHH